ncbi:MAG: dual specificity protein phosphatase family protein [Candidatus Saccharicenans sp.]
MSPTGIIRSYQRKKSYLQAALILPLLLTFLLSSTPACESKTPRPTNWAKPITLAGVSNLYKVSDQLYRSAQPTAKGFAELEKLGVRTVINLREEKSDKEELTGTNLKYYEIPSKATVVKEKDLLQFLKIISNSAEGPYLVHCHHGADRTGLFVAIYRIVVQGWSKEEAILEMQKGGFGFHNTYTNLVKYLKTFDPEKFRRALKNGEAQDISLLSRQLILIWSQEVLNS